jgi:hypothetical protein
MVQSNEYGEGDFWEIQQMGVFQGSCRNWKANSDASSDGGGGGGGGGGGRKRCIHIGDSLKYCQREAFRRF